MALALLTAAALAGCADAPDEETNDEQDPEFDPPAMPEPSPQAQAVLQVGPEEAWAGENVTFDASGSSAPDAEGVSYSFEFGDGTQLEVAAPDEPVVDHTYSAGGVYMVNLTVTAEASGNDSVSDTTSLFVAVHERQVIPVTELEAGLTPSAAKENHTFETRDGASTFNVSLELDSTHLLLDAEGTLRVLDPDGEAVAEEEFSVSAGENDTLQLSGSFNATGEHLVEVELTDGEATYTGQIEIRYEAEA